MYGEKYIFGVTFAITTGWGVMAVLASSVDCHPTQSLVASENAMCSANVSLSTSTSVRLGHTFSSMMFELLYLSRKLLVASNHSQFGLYIRRRDHYKALRTLADLSVLSCHAGKW